LTDFGTKDRLRSPNLSCGPTRNLLLFVSFPVSNILCSQLNFVQLIRLGWGEMDLCGEIMSCHAMPVFHGMGVLQIALVVSPACDLFRVIHFHLFSAICWSGDGRLQTSIPSRFAKSSERIGRDDCNQLLDWSGCSYIPRSTYQWSLPRLVIA